MTIKEVITKVKSLELPPDSYVVYGSGPLAAVGIREVNDIDLLVSSDLLNELKLLGWTVVKKGPNDAPLTRDVFEAHGHWDFSPYSPALNELVSRAFYIDEVPFASLLDVKKWKESSGGEKHLKDVALIDEYLRKVQPGSPKMNDR